MTKNLIIAAALVFLVTVLLPAAPLHCQGGNTPIWDQEGNPPPVKTIDGNVVSVDPQNSIIVIQSVVTFTLYVPDSAKVTNKDGFGIELSDIAAGSYAMAEYYNDKSGRHIARSVNIEYTNK